MQQSSKHPSCELYLAQLPEFLGEGIGEEVVELVVAVVG